MTGYQHPRMRQRWSLPGVDPWGDLASRLVFQKPDRAAAILAGIDAEANADVERWRLIGLPR